MSVCLEREKKKEKEKEHVGTDRHLLNPWRRVVPSPSTMLIFPANIEAKSISF